jgi:effector-binding domain-containing protein
MITTPRLVETDATPAAVIHLSLYRNEMQREMGPAIHEVIDAVMNQGVGPAGPVFANHARFDPEWFDFEVGVPTNADFSQAGRVQPGELPAVRVVQTTYRGPYEGLPEAWQQFSEWIRENEIQTADGFREVYSKGPESSDNPDEWETELSWEIR